MRYVYFVVEGPHDLEFVARFLKPHSFSRVKLYSEVDPYWVPLIPRTFPYKDELSKRMPVPVFFQGSGQNRELAVAIGVAGGDSNIKQHVEENLAMLREPPSAIGVVLDADLDKTPKARFDSVRDDLIALKLLAPSPTEPLMPGQVTETEPRIGIFVLPDNVSQGTLESLLIECAALNYPTLLAAARVLVGSVQPSEFRGGELKDFNKNAGVAKATVSCVASVLKPGKAVQNSIQDNRWVHDAAYGLPRIAAFGAFVRRLLRLEP